MTSGYMCVPAVRDIYLGVQPGEILALLGPNGAGKTTTLLSAIGALKPIKGTISSYGSSLDGLQLEQVARAGVSLLPDNRGMFPTLTGSEHVRICRRGASVEDVQSVLEKLPALAKLQGRKVGLLSRGEQHMLALAWALIAAPKVLLIDEMSLGLAPVIVQSLLPIVRDMARARNMAVVLVEQHIDLALRIADDAVVLNHWRIVLRGKAPNMRENREVVEDAYFGRNVA